eukprot:4771883-Prorocentrum_lima.AAC.1
MSQPRPATAARTVSTTARNNLQHMCQPTMSRNTHTNSVNHSRPATTAHTALTTARDNPQN